MQTMQQNQKDKTEIWPTVRADGRATVDPGWQDTEDDARCPWRRRAERVVESCQSDQPRELTYRSNRRSERLSTVAIGRGRA
jgi:hypothetical protein